MNQQNPLKVEVPGGFGGAEQWSVRHRPEQSQAQALGDVSSF